MGLKITRKQFSNEDYDHFLANKRGAKRAMPENTPDDALNYVAFDCLVARNFDGVLPEDNVYLEKAERHPVFKIMWHFKHAKRH